MQWICCCFFQFAKYSFFIGGSYFFVKLNKRDPFNKSLSFSILIRIKEPKSICIWFLSVSPNIV